MRRQWGGIYRWKNLYIQQLKSLRTNSTRKLQSNKCKIPRTIKNVQVNQEKLLVARNTK